MYLIQYNSSRARLHYVCITPLFFWLGLINYAFVFMDVNSVFPPDQEHAFRVPEKKVKRGMFSH